MEKRLKHFELKETKDYSLFRLYKENRQVNQKKIAEYKESIEKDGLKQPINVKYEDGLYFITDGQHRFFALLELNYHIVFIVDYDANSTSEDIIHINANRYNTKTDHFIHYYATKKYKEYIKLEELYNKYKGKIKPTLINELFVVSEKPKNPSWKITETIRKGQMNVDYNQGETLIEWLRQIYDANNQGNLYQSKIVRALKHIYNNNKNFNINILCNKINVNYSIPVDNNEYKIVSEIKEKYNKYLQDDSMFLV